MGRAAQLGCESFQIFTRSSRSWKYKELDPSHVQLFQSAVEEQNLSEVIVNMPYLPNFAGPTRETYDRSVSSLLLEVERCDILRVPFLVLHLGSHKGKGFQAGLAQVVNALEQALSRQPQVHLLLENSAGTKNSVGSSFEEIGTIIDSLSDPSAVGVCLDTCHLFAAGYDLRTKSTVARTLDEFDRLVGLSRLRVLHVNDSKGGLGSGRDRHQHIGVGAIGEEGFAELFRQLPPLPAILETPVDDQRGDATNLAKVRQLANQSL